MLIVPVCFAGLDQLVVSKVRGAISLNGKSIIKEGQKINTQDFIQYSSAEDMLVCLHPETGLMVFKPQGNIHRKWKVALLILPYYGQRGETAFPTLKFQTLADSFSIPVEVLHRHAPKTNLHQLILIDENQHNQLKIKKINLDGLILYPTRKGWFSLVDSARGNTSNRIAEIEFLDAGQIKRELRLISGMDTANAEAYQKQYLKKQYPNLSVKEAGVW